MMGIDVDHVIGDNSIGKESIDTFKAKIYEMLYEIHGNDRELANLARNDLKESISPVLNGLKGKYVVFSGVFNYYGFFYFSRLATKISDAFDTTVMLTSYDMGIHKASCQVYLSGKALSRYMHDEFDEKFDEINAIRFDKIFGNVERKKITD
jgi:hypothetical protein